MSDLPYMPLWVADLMSDTGHLTNSEFGAYVRLLCALWQHGGYLPDDDRTLKRMAHADRRNWHDLRAMLDQFLQRTNDGRVTQKRLLAVRLMQDQKRSNNAGAARHRWHKDPKPLKSNNAGDANAYAFAYAETMPRAHGNPSQNHRNNSHKSDYGSGPLTPTQQQATATPPAVRAAAPPSPVAALAGPFVPTEKKQANGQHPTPANGPTGSTAFLRDWNAAGSTIEGYRKLIASRQPRPDIPNRLSPKPNGHDDPDNPTPQPLGPSAQEIVDFLKTKP